MKKSDPRIGDRVIYEGQGKTCGVIVEVHDKAFINKDVKVHWKVAPKNCHKSGRGSYDISELKLMRI
jgi:hypothetical protein